MKLACLFLFALAVARTSGRAVEIQAETDAARQGYSSDRVIDRSSASNKKNIHLLAGESLDIYFCLPLEDYVTIDKIAFSNDGWVDNITVSLDKKQIGVLQTHDESQWGFKWNRIYSSGKIGGRQNLVSGLHTITLKVDGGDKWGVELDSVTLTIENVNSESDVACTDKQIAAAGVKKRDPVGRSLPLTGDTGTQADGATTEKTSNDKSETEDTTVENTTGPEGSTESYKEGEKKENEKNEDYKETEKTEKQDPTNNDPKDSKNDKTKGNDDEEKNNEYEKKQEIDSDCIEEC